MRVLTDGAGASGGASERTLRPGQCWLAVARMDHDGGSVNCVRAVFSESCWPVCLRSEFMPKCSAGDRRVCLLHCRVTHPGMI